MTTGIVLAGGRSTRMGRDKALLDYRGVTLLEHAIATLRDAGVDRVVVSGERASHGGIPDSIADAGPVGALASVARECGDGTLLVVPVDMPLLDAASLHALYGALGDAAAVHFRAHPLPWAARLDATLRHALATLMGALPTGPSMRSLHAAVGGIEIDVGDARVLRNVNTPGEWEALAP